MERPTTASKYELRNYRHVAGVSPALQPHLLLYPHSSAQFCSQSGKMFIYQVSWEELNANASGRNEDKVKKSKKIVDLLSGKRRFGFTKDWNALFL